VADELGEAEPIRVKWLVRWMVYTVQVDPGAGLAHKIEKLIWANLAFRKI
jgi:hypothetical protein